MVCNVIENCRCFAYRGNRKQFCGVRKGPRVLPCPEDCCFGGCPDDGSRQPFRILDPPPLIEEIDPTTVTTLIVIAILFIILLYS